MFSALREQSLFCNIIKCEFALESVRFLSHTFSGIDLRPDPEKIRVVRDWKGPTSVTGIRQFLGFTNYFRRFIEGYSFIARPLEELTGKNKRFSWNQECQAVFEALRKALISAPVLRLTAVSKSFRLVTDASNTAVAGVLLQRDESENWHPVAYTSRRLRVEERNYYANERNTLAVIHALRVWRTFLFMHFEVVIDKIAGRLEPRRRPMKDEGIETAFRLDQCKHFRKSKHLLRSEVNRCDQSSIELHLRRSTSTGE